MESEKIFILKLNEVEANALKKLLGSMNDQEFKNFGIVGDDRNIIRDIYDSLEYLEDE